MFYQEKLGVQAVRLALSVIAGTTFVASHAIAQEVQPAKVQKVEITGSNLKRIDVEGPTAVEIIKRTDIEKSGATTVIELLNKMPSAQIQLDGNSQSSYAGGGASVSLRGLDPKYTLILLNGRRLANYGFADGAENSFVDLNSIPLGAIESIEILRDGASAIYGSDAVAGVINFKTRKNYQGIEAAGSVGSNQARDGTSVNATVTAGFGDLDADGHNLLLTIDAIHKDPLWSANHSATANLDHSRFGGSDGRSTGVLLGSVNDYSTAEPGWAIPGCQGSVEVSKSSPDTRCYTNPNTQLSPTINRVGVSAIFTKRLDGQNELFAEIGLHHSENSYNRGYSAFDTGFKGQTAGSTNPALNNLPGPSADGSLAGFTPGDILQITRSIYEAGPSIDTVTSDTGRFVGGWRGAIGKWDTESAITFNQNRLKDNIGNQVLKDVSTASLQSGLLGTGGYNPFIAYNPANVVDPMMTTTSRNATSRLATLDWKMANSELFQLASGPVGFAWGAQFSHETEQDNPDPRSVAGNIVNYGPTASNASRSVFSVYGEFDVPVTKSLEAQLALRGDHYSDFGNSVNPKIALSWHANDMLLFRGSATTSFKAPTLQEISSTTVGYTLVADWARCIPLGYTGANCAYYPRDYVSGNPDLKAEKAKNYSLGTVFQPTKTLSAALDWYAIRQSNTIQALDPQYLVDHEDSIPGYAALIDRDPRNPVLEARYPGLNKGRIKAVHPPYLNVGSTNIQGLDLDVKYALDLGSYGKFNFREVNSYSLQFDQSVAPGQPLTSRLGGTAHPRWSNSFRTAYEFQTYEMAATARTYASTLNIDDPTHTQDAAITNARIPSYTIWDLNLNVKATKELNLNFGINNAFNKAPVYANSTYYDNFVPALLDYVGRYYYVNARYVFK